MNSEPSPVLLAYDGSEDAAGAIACAGRLLGPRPALVVYTFSGLASLLLHTDVDSLTGPIAEAAEELDSTEAAEAERLAANGAELAERAGFEANPIVVKQRGKTWQALIAMAERHEAATIVAGTRGRSGLASVLLGSVSTGLLHHSSVPVLVVPPAAARRASDGPALLCYDGSETSQEALIAAGGLLRSRRALVLHLWQSWVVGLPGIVPALSGAVTGMARELDQIAASQSSEIADDGLKRARAAGFSAQPLSLVCEHGLWNGVIAAAAANDASAVVLGARGLSGISAILGSVSHGVVHHSERPVLIVPPSRR